MTTARWRPDERGLVLSCPRCGRGNRLAYERLGKEFRCGHCKTPLPLPVEPVDIPNAGVFNSLTARSALPVLVDFWASWCGPCKMVAPELVKVARQSAGRWLVVKVDTEALPEVAGRLGIQSIPTLAVFQAGEETRRQAGALPANGILQWMQQTV